MTEKFKKDLQEVYAFSAQAKGELNSLFDKLKKKEYAALTEIDDALKKMEMPVNDETRYALIRRVVTLKSDSLGVYLEGDPKKEEKLSKAYDLAAKMHTAQFKVIQKHINEGKLLSEFYRTVLNMYLEAGQALTAAQPAWKEILAQNGADLMEKCGSDEAILKYLEEHNLFDLCEGQRTDHCYSLLKKEGDGFRSCAYIDLIPEIKDFVEVLSRYYEKLSVMKDDEFHAEKAYLHYIDVMAQAFNENDVTKNSGLFRELDRAWMAISTPLQPTHPFEYYEDKYRAATALEFDVRIDNVSLTLDDVRGSVTRMYKELMTRSGAEHSEIMKTNLESLEKTQLHLGKPLYYFANGFDGLFAAQVIPNDTTVSKELNKKIFAYVDFVYELTRTAPGLELSYKIMPKDFLEYTQDLIENRKDDWYQIYNIETIGHEFGHILYVYGDSEVVMNKTGLYKKGEEWKATTGGLAAYLRYGDRSLDCDVFHVLIERAVRLITWMKIEALNPYYCEVLVHLHLLFQTGMLSFNGEKLEIDLSEDRIKKTSELYLSTYEHLANNYLKKVDMGEFLGNYAVYENGVHLPKDDKVRGFVEHYYALYSKIGSQIHVE